MQVLTLPLAFCLTLIAPVAAFSPIAPVARVARASRGALLAMQEQDVGATDPPTESGDDVTIDSDDVTADDDTNIAVAIAPPTVPTPAPPTRVAVASRSYWSNAFEAAPPGADPMTKGTFGFDELRALAATQNPAVRYFDPLGLGDPDALGEVIEQSNTATIGWIRHAEMKHGRIAMAGFIGYLVHENGIRWPFPLSKEMADYSSFEGLSAPEVWDKIPEAAKWQVIAAVGFVEVWTELAGQLEGDPSGESHYMRGGTPGKVPRWGWKWKWLPNLFDPAGFTSKLSAEEKMRKLNIDINNGRLAMIGWASLWAAAQVPNSVPLLRDVALKEYAGNPDWFHMAPFIG